MSDYFYEEERRELAKTEPWHSYAIPRQVSDEKKCRSPKCRSTNWGGHDRIHWRGPDCPPWEEAEDHSHERVEWAAKEFFERRQRKEAKRMGSDKMVRMVARSSPKGATVVLRQEDNEVEMTPEEALEIFKRGIAWLEGNRETEI